MSLEENNMMVRRLVEEDLNADDRDAADDIVAEDCFDHTNPPYMRYGLEGRKTTGALFHEAYPGVKWTIKEMIAEGDKVVVHMPMTATHRGEFFGIAPTGRQPEIDGIHILRVATGKVAEHWGVKDDLLLMKKLGAVPE